MANCHARILAPLYTIVHMLLLGPEWQLDDTSGSIPLFRLRTLLGPVWIAEGPDELHIA